MKYLTITDSKGFFIRDGGLVEIDKINKEDLLNLIERAAEEDFEMDAYDETLLPNKAQQIIYENLHDKLQAFLTDRTQFDKAVSALYADAIGEYKANSDDEVDPEFTVITEEINPEDIPF